MREMIKMVVVLTVLSAFSGGLLAAVRDNTKEKIENQQLQFVKGPAIKAIMQGASNDPIADKFRIKDGETERLFFVGKFDGKVSSVAFETFGKGFGGDVGVMVGVNIDDDKVIGIGVTTHSETPGLGSKAKTDLDFGAQFKGLSIKDPVKVKANGGQIDALSGATITSSSVCAAVTEAGVVYQRLKAQLAEQMKGF